MTCGAARIPKEDRGTGCAYRSANQGLSVDCTWLRYILLGRSFFGFQAYGFDFGVLPMANILAWGLYRILRLRGQVPRSLLGFEVGGLIATLTYMVCSWVSPNAMRTFVGPVYQFWRLWKPGRLPDIIEALLAMAYLTLPQLLIALAGSLLTRRSV